VTAHAWTDLPVLMGRLDACLAAAVPHARARYGVGLGADPYRGLYIGDDLVDLLVTQALDTLPLGAAGSDRWPHLWPEVCDEPLDPFETAVVMLALAPDVDLKYERIYGYLQDDINARRPRVSLALDLFCSDLQGRLAARDRFSPDATLRRERILVLGGSDDQPVLARALRLDPQLVRHFVGGTGLDERVAARCEVVVPDLEEPTIPVEKADRTTLAALADRLASGWPIRVALVGGDTGVLDDLAAELARSQQLPMLRLSASDDAEFLRTVSLESRLLGYAMHVQWPRQVPAPTEADARMLAAAGDAVIVTSDHSTEVFEILGFTVLPIALPGAAVRRQWWQRQDWTRPTSTVWRRATDSPDRRSVLPHGLAGRTSPRRRGASRAASWPTLPAESSPRPRGTIWCCRRTG
jgi:hypothetical protein